MEEDLDNFELRVVHDEKEDLDINHLTQAIDICLAKLQTAIANNKAVTDPNPRRVESSVYDEAACLTIAQEQIYKTSMYGSILHELFKSNDPDLEHNTKIFRHLLYDLRKNNNELRHLEEDLNNIKHEIIESKMALIREYDELRIAMELKKVKRAAVESRHKKKIEKKIKNINIWQNIIREMILLNDVKLDDKPDLLEMLKKYRKPFQPDL